MQWRTTLWITGTFFYCSEMNKRPIRTRSLSLKYAELRCKKSLRWQTYSLLTNQSESNDERKKRRNDGPQRTYSTPLVKNLSCAYCNHFSAPSGFVIMFAICSCVATCQLEIVPWSSWLQTCLNLMSMCFVRLLICPDLMRSTLSIRSGVGFGNVMLSELNKDQCQRISLTAVDVAMNSASTVDNDTDAYFNVRQK